VRDTPAFPRWAGYLNLWVAVLIVPGMAMVYSKTGPFAWDGVIALYIPFGTFLVWILVMSPLLFRAINREAAASVADRHA